MLILCLALNFIIWMDNIFVKYTFPSEKDNLAKFFHSTWAFTIFTRNYSQLFYIYLSLVQTCNNSFKYFTRTSINALIVNMFIEVCLNS